MSDDLDCLALREKRWNSEAIDAAPTGETLVLTDIILSGSFSEEGGKS
jgi:hypothetical protein